MIVQFSGSWKIRTITYSFLASARLRTLGSTFSFACDAAPLGKNLVYIPLIRRADGCTHQVSQEVQGQIGACLL